MEGEIPEKTDRRRQDGDGENNYGKLRIGGQRPSTPPSAAAEKKEHVCADCGKVFSSGKALGGHMSSAHVQAGRDYSYKKKKKTPLRRGGGGGSAAAFSDEDEEAAEDEEDLALREYYRGIDGKIRCNLCGKRFPSRKSLFGHMRCHPERGYRGMEPPIDEAEDSGEEDRRRRHLPHQPGGGAGVELERLLWGWSVKGTRGRPPIQTAFSSSSSFSRDEVKLHRAVNNLVSLVKADSPSPRNPNKLQFVDEKRNCLALDAGNFNNGSANKGKGKVVWEPRYRSGEKSSSEEDDDVAGSMSSEDEDDDEEELGMALVNLKNGSSLGSNNNSINNKRKRTSEDFGGIGWKYNSSSNNCGGEEENNNNNKFKCSTCSKCFTSHQALGGHRSSHNKFKVIIQNAIDVVAEEEEDNNGEEEEEDCAIGYQCGVCNKTFATQRALGGHRKCHSTPASSLQQQHHHPQQQLIMASAAVAVVGAVAATTTTTTSSSSPPRLVENRKIILDFDLNEIPDDDMDDAQIE
ncbi:hypothetical protein DM860_006080 [Cuscuta australis]|uniref:C2H2-type domain-containing protein n=1 Tax=Cuscuta australis TaxID=267555 RepID=A0A328DKE8_9ASTE|nr:hypothetical protein DM860_006080 [Cuscuta australis]